MYAHIDDDTALDMLIERVKFWNDDETAIDLFTQYYKRMIAENAYSDFDVMSIVDNDFVNRTTIGTRQEILDNFNEIEDDKILAKSGDFILYYAC